MIELLCKADKEELEKKIDGLIPADGVAGYALMSDGEGGLYWGEASTEPITYYAVTLNLIDCVSSNTKAKIAEGKSYSTVLSVSGEDYTLGTPVITMGGIDITATAWNADTATITIESVTGDVVISCGVAKADISVTANFQPVQSFTGATGVINFSTSAMPRQATRDFIDCTDGSNLKIFFPTADNLTGSLQLRCFAYSDTEGTLVGSFNPDGSFYTNDAWGTPNVEGGNTYEIPCTGYYIRFVIGRSTSISSNAEFDVYIEGVTITKTFGQTSTDTDNVSVDETPTVMMASYDRVYVDTGEYTEDLAPKWDGMFSIHRGYSTAPNNTLQAIWEAKKHGYNCCELDVRYTSDNQIVLNHDATVTGTVNGESVTYTIAETPLATLQTVVIGNTAFPDAKVCSLEDAMRLCRRIGMRPEIDYKVGNEQLYKDCVALSMKYGLQDDTLHCCYSIAYAQIVKTAYEKANLRVSGESLDSDTTLDEYLSKPGNIYAFYSAAACGKTDGSNVGANVENETRILANKAKGYKMYVWNVTPNLLPDVMQWEPDILQLQSGRETQDFYSLIRNLNAFDGLVF